MHLLMGEIRSQECHVRIASPPHYHAAISHRSYQRGLTLTPSKRVHPCALVNHNALTLE